MPRIPTDTKGRILKAAGSLYSHHGCEGTTLDDILTASGITKGAFYHYFKSKDDLCLVLLDKVIDEYQQIVDSIDPDATPFEQLGFFLNELIRLNGSGEWINCRLMTRLSSETHTSSPGTDQKIAKFWRWYEDFYTELIEKSIKQGKLNSRINARMQAKMLISTIAGALTLDNIVEMDYDMAKMIDALMKLLRD
ncbi:MAG: TetR/AcrR family transcriptional regulator [Sedimentisphaerales bacterium]|nr:TetR/AcrR family transcriptional regulator [Sedimentisphaerales bacterium]